MRAAFFVREGILASEQDHLKPRHGSQAHQVKFVDDAILIVIVESVALLRDDVRKNHHPLKPSPCFRVMEVEHGFSGWQRTHR